ncbi:MAG: aminoglycoside 6-adenylyltransferase [Caldilineaceae bacterium]
MMEQTGTDDMPTWPDALEAPTPAAVEALLHTFWDVLTQVGDRLVRAELLLADEAIGELRRTVLAMMLALNGIRRPPATEHLNGYLGASQRQAMERTLYRADPGREGMIGQAVALVVIYRWYAPQLAARFGFTEPAAREAAVLQQLEATLFDWPAAITTD